MVSITDKVNDGNTQNHSKSGVSRLHLIRGEGDGVEIYIGEELIASIGIEEVVDPRTRNTGVSIEIDYFDTKETQIGITNHPHYITKDLSVRVSDYELQKRCWRGYQKASLTFEGPLKYRILKSELDVNPEIEIVRK